MRLLKVGERGFERYLSLVEQRGERDDFLFERKVYSILSDVKDKGDEALLRYTWLFDHVKTSASRLQVKAEEVEAACRSVPEDLMRTLRRAARRIRSFHEAQRKGWPSFFERREPGIRLGQRISPIERVGLYVPGGKASYPSTVLMAAIPAKVAGVREVIMVTPPRRGGVSPAVLVAAHIARVDRIYRVGGVQAIGALAFGTRTIPRVDKIIGPGNRYVAAAKRMVYGLVDIDMVAGPSEIAIVSDGKAPPAFTAADLISQAEHDERALAILVTPSEEYAREVQREVAKQLSTLSRKGIARASLGQRGAILVVRDLDQAIDVVNRIAPEHLQLSLSRASSLVDRVKHAGAIFLGAYTPEVVGDYVAGPNHILPTAGTARFFSPLGVDDFLKRTSVIELDQGALRRFAKDVERLTAWEGLEGHDRAVKVRMERG